MTLAASAEGVQVLARVAARTPLANPDYTELTLTAPAVVRRAKPGQFVHVRLPDTDWPFLRRPFSLAGAEGDRLTLLFKNVGELTARLGRLSAGDPVDVLGPLGTGYDLATPPVERAFLIGGGYGVAPLMLLARALRDRHLAKSVCLLVGARTASQLVWQDRLAAETWMEHGIATDDGSAGFKGTVLDLLATKMGDPNSVRLYGCGPMGMLGAMAARWPSVPSQVAVENQMGCGIGVCMGCVLPVRGGEAYGRYSRICHDGPVFDAARIDWAACPR